MGGHAARRDERRADRTGIRPVQGLETVQMREEWLQGAGRERQKACRLFAADECNEPRAGIHLFRFIRKQHRIPSKAIRSVLSADPLAVPSTMVAAGIPSSSASRTSPASVDRNSPAARAVA